MKAKSNNAILMEDVRFSFPEMFKKTTFCWPKSQLTTDWICFDNRAHNFDSTNLPASPVESWKAI